jgi:hypothetical protein
MASYEPATSFYSCPFNASDIFKPQTAPPPTYYLKNHVRIVYNDDDWPTTPEEGISEEQDKPASKSMVVSGNACTKRAVVSVQPLSLLTAKMREYTQKEEPSTGGSDCGYILKEEQLAFPGGCSGFFLVFSEFTLSPSRAIHVRRGGGHLANRSAPFGIE